MESGTQAESAVCVQQLSLFSCCCYIPCSGLVSDKLIPVLWKLSLSLWPWLLEEHPWLQLGLGAAVWGLLCLCQREQSLLKALALPYHWMFVCCSGLMSFTRAEDVLWWLLGCLSAGRAIQDLLQWLLECLGKAFWRSCQPRSSSSFPRGA